MKEVARLSCSRKKESFLDNFSYIHEEKWSTTTIFCFFVPMPMGCNTLASSHIHYGHCTAVEIEQETRKIYQNQQICLKGNDPVFFNLTHNRSNVFQCLCCAGEETKVLESLTVLDEKAIGFIVTATLNKDRLYTSHSLQWYRVSTCLLHMLQL